MRLTFYVFLVFYCCLPFLSVAIPDSSGLKRQYDFSQTTIGLAFEAHSSGSTSFIRSDGTKERVSFAPQAFPRFSIGGTHFWGRACFYFSMPFSSLLDRQKGELVYHFNQNDMLGARYFTRPLENRRLSPFVGLSIVHTDYWQSNVTTGQGGAEVMMFSVPLQAGAYYTTGRSLIELSARFNYQNKFNYYIDRNEQAEVEIPKLTLTVGYRWMEDLTRRRNKQYYDTSFQHAFAASLQTNRRLSALMMSIGLNTSFFTGRQASADMPWLGRFVSSAMFPELGIGYYVHSARAHINAFYRQYKTRQSGYGAAKKYSRQSALLEVHRYLFNYHGFAAFAGVNAGFEKWELQKNMDGVVNDHKKESFVPGVVFGWDILPERSRYLVVRTNIRYFPSMNWGLPNEKLSLDQLEFNLIQLSFYPERFVHKRRFMKQYTTML